MRGEGWGVTKVGIAIMLLRAGEGKVGKNSVEQISYKYGL